MEKIGLVMGESADLPKEIIQKHQIEIITFKSDWPEAEGLSGENIYQVQREADLRGIKGFAKTSQPSPKVFLDAYKKALEKFKEVICVTVTSKLSGTYNSAIQAKNFLKPEQKEKVFIVDSLSVSGGEALLAFKAFDLIKKGKKTAKKIQEDLESLRSKVHLRVALKDIKWAEASGRVSHLVANWIRKMQKVGIYPLLGLKKGLLKPITIKFGSKDLPTILFNEIKAKTKKLHNEKQKIRVIILHTDAEEAAQRLKKMIEKELRGVNVLFINLVSNIIGNLVGPDSLAIVWVQN
jgi:DegV family protein with EDD domain